MITEQERERLKEFERAHRLAQLILSEGYQDLLDIMESEVVKWELRLLSLPLGSPDQLLRDLQAAARIARVQFEQIQLRLNSAINEVTSINAASTEDVRDRSEYLS